MKRFFRERAMQDEKNCSELGDYICAQDLRDRCNRVINLVICLGDAMESDNFKTYQSHPHLDLLLVIEEGLDEIEQALKYL